MLAIERVDALVIRVPVETEEGGDLGVAWPIEQPGRPAEGRRSVADHGKRMAGVVLAIPVGADPVLPRLPPVDGGQADGERPGRQAAGKGGRGANRERAAPLEAVVAADVVVDAGLKPRQRRQDRVPLRRVPVAARGLPRRAQRDAWYSFHADSPSASSNRIATVSSAGRRGVTALGVCRSVYEATMASASSGRSTVGAEGVGLIGPVEPARPFGVMVQVMLAALVVGQNLAYALPAFVGPTRFLPRVIHRILLLK
jgi:hypothetical protein